MITMTIDQNHPTLSQSEFPIENPILLQNQQAFCKYVQAKLPRVKFFCRAEAVLGMINDGRNRLLIVLKESQKVGSIFQHKIYRVKEIQFIQLFSKDNSAKEDNYLEYYFREEMKNFVFSRTYDLQFTMQSNFLRLENQTRLNFVLNKKILENFIHFFGQKEVVPLTNNPFLLDWAVFLINGSYQSYVFEKCSMIFEMIILARRECSNLGTRYNRRGLNEIAFSANFVEIEQILINKTLSMYLYPVFSSYVQIRASIPLYWFQRIKTFDPTPQIQFRRNSENQHAMRMHFFDLINRYGPHIKILNLLLSQPKSKGKRSSEVSLNQIYQEYYQNYFSQIEQIEMINFDIKKCLKDKSKNIFFEIKKLYLEKIQKNIGKFMVNKFSRENNSQVCIETQKGVIRSNCIDCIDRTNIAQTIFSRLILEQQLNDLSFYKTSFLDLPSVFIKLNKENLLYLEEIWSSLGDEIAYHYCGSKAHNINSKGKTSILVKRYFSNVFGDDKKQAFLNQLQNSSHAD